MTRAAAIIIGDEILSGKVADVNTAPLVAMLRDLGVELWRVSIIGDRLQDICDEVRHCHDRCDWVITSGGIGPTHDDRTMEGVALAFEVPLVRHPEIEGMLRRHMGKRITEEALTMADIPQGSRLLYGDTSSFPIVVKENVYLLPGIPELFLKKLSALANELSGHRKVQASIFLQSNESAVACHMARVEEECSGISIGSYPQLSASDHSLWITVEGTEAGAVASAVDRLLALLPAEQVVRVDR
jgi:molybdenum cofactor synthesis domain-containing protein